ncbi:DUF4412 domain-containing protein [Myxococcota bacterium]|nr:DUF4412 domain-containing protein [Myxococcota bacterium]
MKLSPISALLTVVALAPLSASAAPAFEGVLEMKMTSPGGSGTARVSIGKGGVRSEMSVESREMPMKMTTLMKAKEPDVAYAIDDASKSYGVIDVKAGREMAQRRAPAKYTAKKLGTEKIAGWSTVHAKLTDDRGTHIDVWTSKEILDIDAMSKVMGPQTPADEGLMKALKDVGADGFFVKLVQRSSGGDEMTLELVKVEKKSLPASTFEIPAGYTKRETGMPGMGGMPPEMERQIREQMKNLTPEQKKQLEEMMKGQGR